MKHLNKIFALIAMSVLFYYSPLKAQENNGTLLDSLSDEDELLDSNLVYQSMHDSLNDKGNWIKVVKSEFIKDVNGNETDLDETEYDDNQVVYVWRPFDVSISWAPYDNNGYWIFTDAGWMWISNYSWGWSCYHYGRWWFSPHYGWVWIPGGVWAANWCYWREYGNYYGWYPYGPRIWWRDHHGYRHRNNHIRTNHNRWVFVNKKDFGSKITKNNVVGKEELKEIVKNSKRITSVSLNENGAKYIGPEMSTVSALTGKKIEPKTIKQAEIISKNEVTKEQINKKERQREINSYNGSKSNSNTNGNYNSGNKKENNSNTGSTQTGKETKRNHSSTNSGNESNKNSNNSGRESNRNSNNSGRESNRNSNNSGRESNRNSNSSPKHRSNNEMQIITNDLKINTNNSAPKINLNISTPKVNNVVKSEPRTEVKRESSSTQRETRTETRKESNTVTKSSNNVTKNNNTSSRK